MRTKYTAGFIKNYRKRVRPNLKLKLQFEKRLALFKMDRSHPLLKDHQLAGNKSEYRAFSITGNVRVVYRQFGDEILLYDIGTHNQVY